MDLRTVSALEGLGILLSRTGEVPVVLRIVAYRPTTEHAFRSAVLPHAHHLRYLETFSCRVDASALANAPLLRYLLIHGTFDIPDGFLSAGAGRLQSLFFTRGSLPISCPSLSTLVALRVRELKEPACAASFRKLFHICPRLEFLSLSGLRTANTALLPPGPAPSSLKTLFLSTDEEDYDLMHHYILWKTSGLRHVMLDMGGTRTAYPIPQDFLEGAITLDVTPSHGPNGGRWIVADFPHGGKYAVAGSERDVYRLADFVALVQPSLQHVHTLIISFEAVEAFLDVLANLPTLRHLTIVIDWTSSYNDAGQACMGEPYLSELRCLVAVAEVAPHLESLRLQMGLSLSRPGCAISATDANDLVAFLDTLGPLPLPRMVIQGFAPDVIAGLDPDRLDRLRIRFDTDDMPLSDERFDRANADRYWPFGYDI